MAPPPPHPDPTEELSHITISAVVAVVDRHFRHLLSSPATRRSILLRCTSKLAIPNSGFLQFDDHSVLSNLYWGIETIESAINAGSPGDRNVRLANAEKMLQVPAMLDEGAATAGIENRYIVCCSYFHLSLIRKLMGDEWQMGMHFFQAVLVSPSIVRADLAPELFENLFGIPEFIGANEEAETQRARRYKNLLMYYQVMSYGESRNKEFKSFQSIQICESVKQDHATAMFQGVSMPNTLHQSSTAGRKNSMVYESNSEGKEPSTKLDDETTRSKYLDEGSDKHRMKDSFDIRRLQEMLEESQSDSSISFHSDLSEASDSEFLSLSRRKNKGIQGNGISDNGGLSASQTTDRNYLPRSSPPMTTASCETTDTKNVLSMVGYGTAASLASVDKYDTSVSNHNLSTLDSKDVESNSYFDIKSGGENPTMTSKRKDVRCFRSFSSKFRKKHDFSDIIHHGSFARKMTSIFSSEKDWSEESCNYDKDMHLQLLQGFEKVISTLCPSEGSRNHYDADCEITTMWQQLHHKEKLKYCSTKHEIVDHLLNILSSSKEEKEIRVSVSILLVLISEDKTTIEDIKKKSFHLYSLAMALKRNVHEAAILIYLLNPSPSDIRSLELLPTLLEIACSSNGQKQAMISLPMTPTSASIAIIEVLVTEFDYVTNNMHLAAISSPPVLSKLVNVAMNNDVDEAASLATILMKCMRLNGNCRKFLSQVAPVEPFIQLLQSGGLSAKSATLEYFQELLCVPRSTSSRLLHQIRQVGRASIMPILIACVRQDKNKNQLFAANLLLQLDMLEGTKGTKVFRQEAVGALIEAVVREDDHSMQSFSAFVLSNLGGTFAWTGESYTAAWLLKKAGLTSACHRNMIRDIDWLDPCLQGSEVSASSRMASKVVIKHGRPVFYALATGIQSQTRSVQRDCLITCAWLASEMSVMRPSSLRNSACEILLDKVASFLHPGTQFDERVLACLSIYNYTSGKGKWKLLNFSEGIRESLRRLSGVTWMAEEMLNVTNYVLPTKPRVSCVHTQTLEIVNTGNGSATAIIFYKGNLYTGYSDGSIKVWNIKDQPSMLLWEVRKHKKTVTCFSLFEEGDSLLSGSIDKTVRVWRTIQNQLECVEVIEAKEPIQGVGTCNEKIVMATQSRGLKVCDASRSIQTICKNKHVTTFTEFQRKIYAGCMDSSIQEIDMKDYKETEIRAATTSWKIQKSPINSICVFKGWVYCAGASIEASRAMDWRRHKKPQISIKMSKAKNILAIEVTEDFLYFNTSSSPCTIQIFLREKQQSVGRLSAGSKVTSLLVANDVILCGTEAGLVKGWIPL